MRNTYGESQLLRDLPMNHRGTSVCAVTPPDLYVSNIVLMLSGVENNSCINTPLPLPDCPFTLHGNKTKRAFCCKLLLAVVLGILAIS